VNGWMSSKGVMVGEKVVILRHVERHRRILNMDKRSGAQAAISIAPCLLTQDQADMLGDSVAPYEGDKD
jgi:hypothetical protein